MSITDAILIGEDWISEHYFTTDATSQSFHAQVLGRRKIWDDQKDTGSVRTRFTAARGSTLARLAALDDDPDSAESIRKDLIEILGFTTLGLTHTSNGSLTQVRQFTMPDVAGVALIAATPVETVEDLLEKDADTLAEPYDLDDTTQLTSVPRLLSALFVAEDAPAFALVLAGRIALIAERERWPEGRYLAIDLQLVCERYDDRKGGEVDTALACLSAESLAPDAEGNIWWHAVLDESIKHTVGVSQDLREGVRLSIEIIANDVVNRRLQQGLDPLPPQAAQPLAKQALRFLYRILFLLYAEASPELGVLPTGATEYDQGYSLDRLRELIQVPLTTPTSESGTHLYDSLAVLFTLVDGGYDPQISEDDEGLHESLVFRSLRADLFRAEATSHINDVKLSNARLQQVLQHLLLSKETRGRDRGFISYAELGINQLGAVYEGLMSYTGRFAESDLYEVAKGGDSSKGSWLVPVERAGGIDDKDFVRIEDPITGERKPVLHTRGSFVFRLAGRERQQSASYYTPEVLTRFTVGQALEELLDQDGHKTPAAEILRLTVCEPALGSGAFAIEAVRQLATAYLSRRQEELSERIDPEEYPKELQKVKAYLALHNVYGVDLNATAVELAEISLWLDTMVEGLQAPWFGLHLRRGTSLIGARRSGFTRSSLGGRSWQETVPTPIRAHGKQTRTELIHHFLLPADGWGAAAEAGKDIKELVPEAVTALKTWRRSTKPKPTKKQLDTLRDLADRVEDLWGIASRRLEIAEQQIRRDIPLWGGDTEPVDAVYVSREQIEQSLADPDGAYRRLRRVMDAWCALWFWPLTEEAVHPPTMEQWYAAVSQIVGGNTMSAKLAKKGDETLADVQTWDQLEVAEYNDRVFAGAKPVADVIAAHPWLGVCERVADQQGFFHWELDFAPIFAARGGFDLQVGNPPWVRPRTDVEALLAEGDPWWQLASRQTQEAKAARRQSTLEVQGIHELVVNGTADVVVLATLLANGQLFPHLHGLQPDLYRCFIEQTWRHQSPDGCIALIHPESHFTDEKAGLLRRSAYARLRRHWQFINELGLFEIQNQRVFGVHIYAGPRESPRFLQAAYLYHPDTIERSLRHDGQGDEPGFKDPNDKWDLRPHRSRVQVVDASTLQTWRSLLESEAVPVDQSRMVYTISQSPARVLARLSGQPRLAAVNLMFARGWDESIDRKKGYFETDWGPATSWSDVILQGSHLHVSTAFYKTPNATLASNVDWSIVDVEALEPSAVPVTTYKPRGSRKQYDLSYSRWGEKKELASRDFYRVAWRNMAANTGERTLTAALIPPGTAHIHGVTSAGLPGDDRGVIRVVAVLGSLLADFATRAAPKSTISGHTIARLPDLVGADEDSLILRALRLNCLTDAYSGLWRTAFSMDFYGDSWTGGINYPGRPDLADVSPEWSARSPLRRASDRRQALVEIDALVAMMVGLSVDELCTIYRTQFAVLYGYDRNTYFYDANGRLVPTPVLQVFKRKSLTQQDTHGLTLDERTHTNASGNTYVYELPFVTLDREADMRAAYAHFQQVLAERGGA